MDYKALALAISEEIKRRKMQKTATLNSAGLHLHSFSYWERGKAYPVQYHCVEGLCRLIKSFKIDLKAFANLETFSGRLICSRLSNGLTITRLSKKSSLGITTITRYENHGYLPETKSLLKLAEALNVSADWLLNGDKAEPIRNGLVDMPQPTVQITIEEATPVEEPKAEAVTGDECFFDRPIDYVTVGKPFKAPFDDSQFCENDESEKDAAFQIDIYIKHIGNDDVNAVNARELWEKLGVATRFNDWIKRRIAMYDFAENSEWITLPKSEKPENKGFQEPIDYFISLDMAKELSMVENNYQGKIARRYFIECEKKANGIMIDKGEIKSCPPAKFSIREINQEFKEARELAFNRGFTNGKVNDAAVKLLKQTTGIDLDAIIGKPVHKMDVSKLSQRDLLV